MTRDTNEVAPPQDPRTASQSGTKRHFDTFETKFFQQGEEGPAVPVEVERFDDLDEGAKSKKFVPSRHFILGVAIGSAFIAIIGSLVIWRSGSRSKSTVEAKPAPIPAARVAPIAIPLAATPTPASVAVRIPPSATLGAVPTAVIPVAATVDASSPETPPSAVEPVKREVAVLGVEKTEPVANSREALSRCKKAIKSQRSKAIFSLCADAFSADPNAADIAVTLAKIAFDRGNTAQAFEWGKKAIAADPNAADAYVFIGGAEQSAGHGKAAKEAYKRYLQLAPTGRYAADLRAIVGSL
jgi:hypothetical protein